MIFSKDFLIPHATPATSPAHQTLDVCRGLIYRVEFQFPAGCAGLAYFALYDGGHQLYPSSPGEFFHSDAIVIGFDDTQFKLVAPWTFDLYGYNLDDTYDHTVYVRVGMVTEDKMMARFIPEIGYEEMIKLMEAETAEQQATATAAKQAVLASPFPWLRR